MTTNERGAVLLIAEVLADLIAYNAHIFVGGQTEAQRQVDALAQAQTILKSEAKT